jgi:hypothetical protein
MSNLKSTVSIQTDFVTPIEVRGEEISVPGSEILSIKADLS